MGVKYNILQGLIKLDIHYQNQINLTKISESMSAPRKPCYFIKFYEIFFKGKIIILQKFYYYYYQRVLLF